MNPFGFSGGRGGDASQSASISNDGTANVVLKDCFALSTCCSNAFNWLCAVCTDSFAVLSDARSSICASGPSLVYSKTASLPHLPKIWILHMSMHVADKWMAPVARAEWPVQNLAPLGCVSGRSNPGGPP